VGEGDTPVLSVGVEEPVGVDVGADEGVGDGELLLNR
jgi:hypothetical protein